MNSMGESAMTELKRPDKITPALGRGAILALLAKNEGRVLDVDEIGRSTGGVMSPKVIYKTLNELEDRGIVERIWLYHMRTPRFGIDEKFELETIRPLYVKIVKEAGVDGITKADLDAKLIERLIDYGMRLPMRPRK